jgi:transposase
MSKALSLDLRQRTLAAVLEEGLSHREAAARFKVSAASGSCWRALAADGAMPMHGPLGGDRRNHLVEGHADAILTVFHARRDMTLAELQAELAERGLRFGYGTLWRFFARRGYRCSRLCSSATVRPPSRSPTARPSNILRHSQHSCPSARVLCL